MKIKYYRDRIKESEKEQQVLKKQNTYYSLLRLVTLLLGLVLIYFLYGLSNIAGTIALISIMILFVLIIKKHNIVNKRNQYLQNLIDIYNNEINLYNNAKNIFGSGNKYIDNNHNYSSDLDLFGDYSLFNHINRTVSHEGEKILASWFTTLPFNKAIILQRQEIIKELAKKENFKENFLNTLFLGKEQHSTGIEKWLSVFSFYFYDKKILKVLIWILPVLTILSLTGGFVFPVLWKISILLLAINYIIFARHKKAVDRIHNHISNQQMLFYKYSLLIDYITKEKFEHPYLKALQKKISGKGHIKEQLKRLSVLIKKLDFRLNFLISPILNLLLHWDIHQAMQIEKWMKINKDKVSIWLNTIGEFDALLSMSILHFNNPDWVFAVISDKDVIIKTKDAGHPLLEKSKRINNDYEIEGKGKFDIVTGSNMAGKSTFLRTIGLNSILALAGCPVCAKEFTISDIHLITYMRINDSLEDNLSSFHAELERIKKTLNFVKDNDNCFLLMDEILRGTNSEDRHVGSVALIKQLIKYGASGIIATHDLKLTELALTMPDNIRNFNFSVKTQGEDLFFDYKLNYGICDSFNASILMKKIGIEIEK